MNHGRSNTAQKRQHQTPSHGISACDAPFLCSIFVSMIIFSLPIAAPPPPPPPPPTFLGGGGEIILLARLPDQSGAPPAIKGARQMSCASGNYIHFMQ
jgi:hypothetical protein